MVGVRYVSGGWSHKLERPVGLAGVRVGDGGVLEGQSGGLDSVGAIRIGAGQEEGTRKAPERAEPQLCAPSSGEGQSQGWGKKLSTQL